MGADPRLSACRALTDRSLKADCRAPCPSTSGASRRRPAAKHVAKPSASGPRCNGNGHPRRSVFASPIDLKPSSNARLVATLCPKALLDQHNVRFWGIKQTVKWTGRPAHRETLDRTKK